MNKRYIVIASIFVLFIVALATPSLWAFYRWTEFPESSAEHVILIQTKFGIGHDCGGPVIGVIKPSREEIKACFSSSAPDQTILDESQDGTGSITRTYRCDANDFSGEITYIFYETSAPYICSYKIADKWENILRYKVGDIAGYSPDPSYLTRLLISVFESLR